MGSNLLKWAGCAALFGATLSLATPASANSVVVDWDEACLQGIRENKPGPTIVSRMTTVVHTAMYDAWACYDAKAVGTRFGGFLPRPAKERTEANNPKAVSFAALQACPLGLYPFFLYTPPGPPRIGGRKPLNSAEYMLIACPMLRKFDMHLAAFACWRALPSRARHRGEPGEWASVSSW